MSQLRAPMVERADLKLCLVVLNSFAHGGLQVISTNKYNYILIEGKPIDTQLNGLSDDEVHHRIAYLAAPLRITSQMVDKLAEKVSQQLLHEGVITKTHLARFGQQLRQLPT